MLQKFQLLKYECNQKFWNLFLKQIHIGMCFTSFYSCCAFGPIFNHFNLCYPTLVMTLKLSLQDWLVLLFLIKAYFWNTTFLLGDTFKIKVNLLFNTNKHMKVINLKSRKTIFGILVNYWITFAHKNVM
jgi:hypothetical protein